MSLAGKELHLCSCNGTMPLDAAALARALELAAAPTVRTMLCQRELAAFADGAHGDVVVACTQEARLFGDVAEEGGRTQTIRFVNIRETGGWSAEATAATPKIAALLALAALPEPEPVPQVAYRSEGQLLISVPPSRAPWAKRSRRSSAVTVLVTGRAAGAELPAEREYPVSSGRLDADRRLARRVRSRVGAGKSDRPRPVHALQRLRARLSRGGDRLQLPDRPRALQGAPRVRGRVRRDGAIDFARSDVARSERFDLVLDLQRAPQVHDAPAAAGLLRPRRGRRSRRRRRWRSSPR